MEWVVERAVNFMDGAIRKELPFFLYFAATLPHTPVPHINDSMTLTPDGDLPSLPDISKYCTSCYTSTREAVWETANQLSDDPSMVSDLACLLFLDDSIGVFHDFLLEKGVMDNTYMVIAADHGPSKGLLYETGIRVPLYVVGPGVPKGHLVTELVSFIDMAPSFLEVAGCYSQGSFPIPMAGLSVVSLASAQASSLDRTEIHMEMMLNRATVTKDYTKTMTYFDIPQLMKNSSCESCAMQVIGKSFPSHKFEIAHPAVYDPIQVYNLSADPSESVSLAFS
jgi:arylsulfatase A-like enzyme